MGNQEWTIKRDTDNIWHKTQNDDQKEKKKKKQKKTKTKKNTQHRKLNNYLPSPLENQLYVHTEN